MLQRPQPAAVAAWPVAVLMVAMAGFQSGGVLSKALFPLVGVLGTVTLRTGFAALMLMAIGRPWRGARPTRPAVAALGLYGLSIAGVNSLLLLAIRTLPIGIAVAILFLGPLGTALALSRRPRDAMWALLAAGGVVALLPLDAAAAPLDAKGLGYAFCGAAAWAGYIVAGRRVSRLVPGGAATAIGLTVAALLLLPLGIAEAGWGLLSMAVLPTAILTALVANAIPFRLEMMALSRLPPRVFGVLMSLEPVFGALFAWVVLGERLTGRQGVGIALIIAASAGATWTATRPAPKDGAAG